MVSQEGLRQDPQEGLRQDVSAGMVEHQASGSEHIHQCSKQLMEAGLPLAAHQILSMQKQILLSPPNILFFRKYFLGHYYNPEVTLRWK